MFVPLPRPADNMLIYIRYQHISSAKLSLPIPGLTISAVLLLLFALIDSTLCPRWAKRTRARRAIGRGMWLFQGVATIVLATLLFSYIPSSDARDCLLSTLWQRIFSSHDAQTIRRIQDAFNCCGFNTVRDRAWPFPNHERRADARRCMAERQPAVGPSGRRYKEHLGSNLDS